MAIRIGSVEISENVQYDVADELLARSLNLLVQAGTDPEIAAAAAIDIAIDVLVRTRGSAEAGEILRDIGDGLGPAEHPRKRRRAAAPSPGQPR